MRKLLIAVAASMALTGCLAIPAIIADLESDKVVVQGNRLWTEPAVIEAKAREGCAIHNKAPHGPLSSRCRNDGTCQHLFACK